MFQKMREEILSNVRTASALTPEMKLDFFKRVGYTPHPEQLRLHISPKKYKVAEAGRRGGKSKCAEMEAAAHSFLIPNSLVWIVGPTYELASKVFTGLWRLIYWKMKIDKQSGCSEAEMRINLPNGSRIRGKTGENPDNLVGDGLDFCVIDEGQKLADFIWPECLIPALSDRGGGALWIGSLEGEENFMYSLWELAKGAADDELEMAQDWGSFTWPSWSNTVAFPGGYNDEKLQRARRNMSREDFDEQFGARPKRNPLAVLKEFDRRVHIEPCRFREDYPVYLGIDPSRSVDPYAVVAVQDIDHHLQFFDEFYESGVLTEDVKDDLAGRYWFYKVKRGVCDDEAPDDIIRWCKQPKRVPVSGAHKPDIAARVGLYRKFLRDPSTYNNLVRLHFEERTGLEEPEYMNKEHDELIRELEASLSVEELKRCSRISIDPSCRNMVKEHAGWAYMQAPKERNIRDKPKPWLDHTTDAASYLVWSIFRYGKRRPSERYVDEPL